MFGLYIKTKKQHVLISVPPCGADVSDSRDWSCTEREVEL